MNLTFDKSKLSCTQLFALEKMQQTIKNNPKMRKTNLTNLFKFWTIQKGLNIHNENEFNYLLYYFIELGFTYDEILNEVLDHE